MSIGDCPNWPACGHKVMGQCDADMLGTRPVMAVLADRLQSIRSGIDAEHRVHDRTQCVGCNRWNPIGHPESHGHDDDCTEMVRVVEERNTRTRLDMLIAELRHFPGEARPFGDPTGTFADKRGTFADTTGCFKAPSNNATFKEQATEYRTCEFCGCNTNAAARACCDKGRDADRATGAAAYLKGHTNG